MYQVTFKTETKGGSVRLRKGLHNHIGLDPIATDEMSTTYMTDVPVDRVINFVRMACLTVRLNGDHYYCADNYNTDEYDLGE